MVVKARRLDVFIKANAVHRKQPASVQISPVAECLALLLLAVGRSVAQLRATGF